MLAYINAVLTGHVSQGICQEINVTVAQSSIVHASVIPKLCGCACMSTLCAHAISIAEYAIGADVKRWVQEVLTWD